MGTKLKQEEYMRDYNEIGYLESVSRNEVEEGMGTVILLTFGTLLMFHILYISSKHSNRMK